MTMARRRVPSSGFRPTQESAPVGQYDWGLIALFLMLLCIGLLMVLSASGVVAERINGDKYFFFKRQLIYAVIGGVVMWVLAAVPRHILYKLQYPFLLFVLMLLFVTLSPLGARVNGAQRWISVKFFSIQPLEFAKIALALYLAYFMSTKQELVKTFSKGIIPPFAMTALFCFLLLAQPDFGGAVVLSLILFFMCLIGGTRFIYLFMAIGVGLAGALALIIFEPYRARRLVAFLDPFAGCPECGVSACAVPVRARLRRLLRRGHGRQFAEDVLSARSAQRLYHGGGGRGARLFRHDADHGAVRHAVHALLQDHHGAVGSA